MKKYLLLSAVLAFFAGPLRADNLFKPDQPNIISFPPTQARFVRLVIPVSQNSQPCIDELEIYSPNDEKNLALATNGAQASASSCLPGYAIHQIAHLNDGKYGNSYSWIAAGTRNEWAQIELSETVPVDRVVFSRDRDGHFFDRMPVRIEIQVSLDGSNWQQVAQRSAYPIPPEEPYGTVDLLRYAFECEDLTWKHFDPSDSTSRVLRQFEDMIVRFSAKGMDVSKEHRELIEFRKQLHTLKDLSETSEARQKLFFQARLAKRRLFLRAPELKALQKILFVKRHPFNPSHNYSVIFDATGGVGGGICVLQIPRLNGFLEPGKAEVKTLFDSKKGIARNPAITFDAQTIYFGYRTSKDDYYHLYAMNRDGGNLMQLTDGPFHDYFPCLLPDGGLAFISTRCKAKFLCWRPQAFVLFRMNTDGSNIRPLSYANLSEWTPSIMRDGRIIWMRSEYLDKGANFGHTLWAIRPDGTHPELIFGNNTTNCYANGHDIPDSTEILCTLVSHGGDLNGPIALLDVEKGRSNPQAISNITPDVKPHYDMDWARQQCFRDPVPVSRDYFLCSHAPYDKFGLYVIDRWGNRELLYLDLNIGSMSPVLLRRTSVPPVLDQHVVPEGESPEQGQFFVRDVYLGLEPYVKRPSAKYLRICQEMRADLIQLPNGEYQKDHEPFSDWYATPVHKVNGPYGWPSYVAKGDLGIVPIEKDGSANFYAPAGKVLYFQVLDENFNELQRMRSVVQLQPGEIRGCIGCHEDRMSAPPSNYPLPLAMRREPDMPKPPSWGAGAFSYEKVVQPVWDNKCVSCHNAQDEQHINLTGTLDVDKVPASYRTVIEKGWVNYFDFSYGKKHSLAPPLSFGTLKSKLWQILDTGHYDVQLTNDEIHRIKCWTDLNCPLWPDYIFRLERKNLQASNRPD
ncbi:MAG: discoidin domain-containing protein [Sedimentisphaerales bacterium]|nr:discoidin domain-containing protein [Sedimentisphaerales bacterium]